MKARRIFWALLAVALSVPAMAQNVFKGTIVYSCMVAKCDASARGKAAVAKPAAAASPLSADLASVQSPRVAETPKEGKCEVMFGERIDGDFRVMVDEKTCLSLFNNLLYLAEPKAKSYVMGIALPGEPIVHACQLKPCDMKPIDCNLADQMASLMLEGAMEKLDPLQAQVYHPTEETKEVAGHQVRRYTIEDSKCSLWVAEELTFQGFFAPFWGMNHPVLEFDLAIRDEEGETILCRMVAEKLSDQLDSDAKESVMKRCEYTEKEEVMHLMREFGIKR